MTFKPRALYIRPAFSADLSDFYKNIFIWREKALEHYFQLSYVFSKEDLQGSKKNKQIVDLIIFNIHDEQIPIEINEDDLPHAYRIALLSFDAKSRSVFPILNYFKQLNVKAFFALDSSMAEYAPSIKQNLYYWLWFINTEECKNYNLPKDIDILISSGNYMPSYQWRSQIFPLLKGNFKCTELAHFLKVHGSQKVTGEEFSKLLNRSKITPTCGAFNKIMVLKHVEIPASYSCLLSEETPVIKQMGFVNGVNCIFATPENVVSKLQYYFANEDKLQQITKEGYELIVNNHTIQQRTQLLQWFNLESVRKDNQVIIQKGFFTDLELVEKDNSQKHCNSANERFWDELKTFDKTLILGDVDKIPSDFFLNYIHSYYPLYPGILLRASLYYLVIGRPAIAFFYATKALHTNQPSKDPVLITVLLLCLQCLGMDKLALKVVESYQCVSTNAYQLVKWIVYRANNSPKAVKQFDYISQYNFEFVSELKLLDVSDDCLKSLLATIFANNKRRKQRSIIEAFPSHQNMTKPLSNLSIKNGHNHMFSNYFDIVPFKPLQIMKTKSLKLILFKINYLIDHKICNGRKYKNMHLY